MTDFLGWVAVVLGLALSAAGLWLTVLYGKQANEFLQRICVKLGLEGPGDR
jgi:hypothetical protein